MLRILRAALAAAAGSAVAISACYAQSAPAGHAETGAPVAGAEAPPSSSVTTVETLPPIVVQQGEPSKPPARPKKEAAARKPSTPRAPVVPNEIPQTPLQAGAGDANPLVNPGTPSAGVVPIMGAASSPGAQTATAIDVSRLEDEPLFP